MRAFLSLAAVCPHALLFVQGRACIPLAGLSLKWLPCPTLSTLPAVPLATLTLYMAHAISYAIVRPFCILLLL